MESGIYRGTVEHFRRGDVDHRFKYSPIMGMDAEYHWRITPPSDRLVVRIQSRREGKPIFDATMNLRRAPMSDRSLAAHLLRYPFITVKLICAIYFEALRLWLK